MPNKPALTYESIIAIGAARLGPDEFWVIDHDEGTLWDTASKRMDRPVQIICKATGEDWGELRESGFRLARKERDAQAP